MANRGIHLGWTLLPALILAFIDFAPLPVHAQGYPAYGAWRGRARTVERPHVTRSRVRWGSGVTPTGATMITTIATDPNVLGLLGGVVGIGRADERLTYVTEQDLRDLEDLRAARRMRQMEERAQERSREEPTIRQTLEVHRRILDRLERETPVGTEVGLDAEVRRFLADAQEMHQAQGATPRLPAVRQEGRRLEGRYGAIHEALRETNAALEKLERARQNP